MKKISKILIYVFLILMLAFTAFPIIYTIAASFKTNAEILTSPERLLPAVPTFDNYKQAWNSEQFRVGSMLWNSSYYTLICVAFTLLTSSLAAYAFERGSFFGKKVIFAVFSSLMFITMGSITVYPMFEVLSVLGLAKSLWGLIIVKIFGISIVNIYLVRSYIHTLPTAIDESAEIDGCSFYGIFFRIIMPLTKPILATIAMLTFQQSWNDYLMPTIFTITKPAQRTLIVGIVALKNSGESAASWNLMLAGTSIALIPVLLAYSVGNKYFVSGLAAGAVKG